MTTPKRLQRAIRQLLRLKPFWAMVLLRLQIIVDRAADFPMATDGTRLIYNPARCKRYSDPEIVFILAHEVLHVIGAHHCRRQGRDPKGWNVAADYAVNDTLITQWGEQTYPTRTPPGALYAPRFHRWSAEAIYAELYKNQNGQQQQQQQPGPPAPGQGPGAAPQSQNGQQPPQQPQGAPTAGQSTAPPQSSPQSAPGAPGGAQNASPQSAPGAPGGAQNAPTPPPQDFGHIMDAPGDPKQAEKALTAQLAEAATVAAGAGINPDGATRRQLERAKVSADWERHLAAYLLTAGLRAGCEDFSWSRPQPYLLQAQCLYIPSTVSNDPPPFTVGIDTSGSIRPRQLAEMAAGLRGILDQWENARADILYCDAEIQGRSVCYTGAVHLEPKGGGGTLYGPVFDDDPGRALLVYFTDLDPYRREFPPKPAYPVLWVYTGRKETPPPVPYGQVVRLRAA